MTLQTLNCPFVWPELQKGGASGAFNTTTPNTLTTAGDYYASVQYADRDMTINVVGFFVSAPTGSPTADIRIETLDAAGLPSGTLWATNTNVVTGTLGATAWALFTLTAPATITRGQGYAVKIAYNSGTSFGYRTAGQTVSNSGSWPLDITKVAGGAVTRTRRGTLPIIGIGNSSSAFYFLKDTMPGISAFTVGSAFNNTNAAKRGLRFQIPFTGSCCGIRFERGGTSLGNFNICLFDDAGTLLATKAIDGDFYVQSSGYPGEYFFDASLVLSAGTWYRAAIEPSTATNVDFTTVLLISPDLRAGWPGGLNTHYTTFASGVWTDTATSTLPFLDLMFDKLDDGAGAGGGLLVNPGMNGGMT